MNKEIKDIYSIIGTRHMEGYRIVNGFLRMWPTDYDEENSKNYRQQRSSMLDEHQKWNFYAKNSGVKIIEVKPNKNLAVEKEKMKILQRKFISDMFHHLKVTWIS